MLILLVAPAEALGPPAIEIGADVVRDRETNALLEIRSVTVNGAPVSPRPTEKLRLPSPTRTVTFGFGPTTNAIPRSSASGGTGETSTGEARRNPDGTSRIRGLAVPERWPVDERFQATMRRRIAMLEGQAGTH